MDSDFVVGIDKSIDAAKGITGKEYPSYLHNTVVTEKLDELAEAIGEGGGGASALSDLTDVDISGSVQGGKVLKYNAVEEKWAPGDDSGNVQSDWNESDPTSGAYILNKPTISQDTWRPVSVDGNLTLTNVAGGDIINLIVQGTCAYRTFINNSGTTKSSRNWSATPYISVTPNKLYKLIGVNNGEYGETAPQHAFYNANHEFISCVPSTTYDITPPDNTAYIRLSICSEEPDTNVIKFYRVHGNLNLISGNHISVNGDYGDVEISYDGPAIPTPTASDIDKVIKVESDGQGGAQYSLGVGGSTETEIPGTLAAGESTVTLQNAAITTSSKIDYYADAFGVHPINAVVTTGQIVLTYRPRATATGIKVVVS